MGFRPVLAPATAGLLTVLTATSTTTAAAAAQVTDLDDGCYALRVTTTGTTSGDSSYIEKASVGYGTRGTVTTAEPIAFEATTLGRYRLYDADGGILYQSAADWVWAGSEYGIGAVLESVIGGTDLFGGDDDWPTFTDWPTPTSILHQQAYYTGLERAWEGGLSVVNALLVGNRVICELYPGRVSSCDEMDQIRVQAELLDEMQDYVDAQNGGAGQGWFRIATTPEEVREIVADGKLAVTIGVEASEAFGCRLVNGVAQCDESDIDAGLDEFQELGISGFYPVHKFDNAFGGTRFDSGATGVAVNLGNYLSTGTFWSAESCPNGPSDNEQLLSDDDAVAVLDEVASLLTDTELPAGSLLPVYPEGPVGNTRGLTDLGEYLIEQMMERGMIISIDHMGVRTADAVLDRAEAAGYSGVISAHTWSDREMTARTAELSGFVAGYAYSASDAGNGQPDFITEWEQNTEAAGESTIAGYGYGSDVNGLAIQPAARLDAGTDPLEYPFTTPNGAVFDQQVLGERTWDINTDGVAQYGMFADWPAGIVGQSGDDALEDDLMNSAEAYVSRWEESRAWQD